MTEELITNGVTVALVSEISDVDKKKEISAAIAASAVFDEEGSRQLLTLDQDSSQLVQYDIPKAIFAAAGVLGAAIPLTTCSMGIASILAGIGALGALQGLSQPLSRTCAIVVHSLLSNDTKQMSEESLREAFFSVYDAPKEIAEFELKRVLEHLEKIGSVKCKEGNVRLVERIIIRT